MQQAKPPGNELLGGMGQNFGQTEKKWWSTKEAQG